MHLDKMEQSTGKAYTRPMSKTEFEELNDFWTAYMATTDDLIISIRADVGRLESQLRNIDQQLGNTTRQGNETASAIKSMALQFLSLGAAIEGIKKLTDVNRKFGILKAGLETATGSLDGANQAFAALQQFAQTTPIACNKRSMVLPNLSI